MQLVIGNKNYSSWSLRPWLLLSHFGIEFEEVRIRLFEEGFKDSLRPYSPTLKVPVLIDEGSTVWDSLAICEYVNEKYLGGAALPTDIEERGRCRSYCSEMHAGFYEIRNHLPMNCRARRRLRLSTAIKQECARIDNMWQQALAEKRAEGPFLFGPFSVADSFFAPVVTRFRTYGVEVSAPSAAYMETMLQTPALLSWLQQAAAETEILEDYELGEPV